ncbi:hypothetical protein ACIOK4_00310 [Streptomyces bottropensis]|uniref:hypothetical protein n=1 Tax=Streptomyces bottropensis TaxID=42235 RepID=UPI0037FDDFC5
MSKPDERLVEGVDYDHGDYDVLGVDEPCGEGMCQCRCGGGCECPGDPDEWQPGQCDGCYGGPYCACEAGQGADRAEDCRCGPPADEPPSQAAVALAQKIGEAGL